MLIIVAVIAIALLAVGITLILRSVTESAASRSDTLGQIRAYGFHGSIAIGGETDGSGGRASLRDVIDRVAAHLGSTIGRRLSRLGERELRKRLISAGMYTTSPGRIFGYQVILGVGIPVLWLWLAALAGITLLLYIGGTIILAAAGWILPLAYIDRIRRKRIENIEYDLPDLIDLLVVTIEAGLSFTSSLRVAAGRLTGPLAQELRLTLQESSMGLTLTESLNNLLRRADTPGIRSFVRGMTQGEQLGVSTGQIMRTLAIEMRKKRKAAAEERAQKAPIKMLFPMLIFIFPAMFVIVLLPAILRIIDTLGSGVG